MARALARSTASSASNPVLDLWTLVGGAVAAVETAEFQVYDISTDAKVSAPVQVYPVVGGTWQAGTSLAAGHYVAAWTPGGAEPLGRHRLVWSVLDEAGGTPRTQSYEFDVVPVGLSLAAPAYALLSDLRDEGMTPTALADKRGLSLIQAMSRRVERWTRRFFDVRHMTLSLDGAEGATQFLDIPIVALSSVAVDGETVDAETFRVFNRNLTAGWPDDRGNPRLTFSHLRRFLTRIDVDDRPWGSRSVWWPGAQNITVSGLFGYTDRSPLLDVGETPTDIARVVMMLVDRERIAIGDAEGRAERQNIGRVRSVSTADQSISYGEGSEGARASTGAFTGDADIDEILLAYAAAPRMAVV
jgi:hypothetical protein